MKGLKYSKKLKEESLAFSQMIELYCDKINKEYQKQMYALLENISKGEGLELTMLQKKYLKKITHDETETEDNVEQILDKIIYNNKTYYIDKNNENDVFDTSFKIVGKYNNSMIEFITS